MNRSSSFLLSALIAIISVSSTFGQYSEKATIAIQFLNQQSKELRLSESDLVNVMVSDEYTSQGVTYLPLCQQVDGILIWNSNQIVSMDQQGKVLTTSGKFISGVIEKVESKGTVISAEQAVGKAAGNVGLSIQEPLTSIGQNTKGELLFNEAGISKSPIAVMQYFQKTEGGLLRLVWNVNIQELTGKHWWNIRVDANTGAILEKNDWVANCAFDAPSSECGMHDHTSILAPEAPAVLSAPNDYNVFALPIESPNHGNRTIQNAPWNDALNASPYGWHDINGNAGAEYTITRGNNVHAQDDVDGNDGSGYSPNGGASLSFNYPINFNQDPSNYQDAAITNLFYWNNILHDVLYQYGFDEPSGNFQENNYGNGGIGSDYVYADAQDGYDLSNAFFTTPPEGSNPRMEMFLWNSANPYLDGDLDNGIIAHEFGHGVSNRLVGGPSNTSCLYNNEQMGEGWSDILSLLLTMQPGDQAMDARGMGTFALDQSTSGAGIRPSPYSTSFGVNAYSYNDLSSLAIPHGVGFLWCTMLWEMNWALIDEYGFDDDIYNGTGGNNICLQLILDGLKLTPCEPGFEDGRDAILLADQINNGGVNQSLIWEAFAKRGLGFSADQGNTNSTSDGNEAFDMPLSKDMGVTSLNNPVNGVYLDCFTYHLTVEAVISNLGLEPQTNIPVSYQLDGGSIVSEVYNGTIQPGLSASHSFVVPISLTGQGTHQLDVWSNLSGDGDPLNDQVTISVEIVDGSGAIEEDFEGSSPCSTDYDCGVTSCPLSSGWRQFQNGSGDDVDWRVNQGETPSGDTGPNQDYAPGTANGNYVYLEASNGCNGMEAVLISPCLDLGAYGIPSFQFAYNMDGGNMGDLHLDLYNGTDWISDIMPVLSGDQGGGWNTRIVPLAAFGSQNVILRFRGVTGDDYQSDIALDAFSMIDDAIGLSIKAYLEGPYNPVSDQMDDDLRIGAYIPAIEPYSGLGFTNVNGGGGESIDPAVLTVSGSNAIVDWVFVELRQPTNSSIVVATRSALLQRDGDVVEIDGHSPLEFEVSEGNYFVAIRHRNHLGIMTQNTVLLSTTPQSVDFSTGETTTYGTGAMNTNLPRKLMWMGNSSSNPEIKYTGAGNDRDLILVAIGGDVPTETVDGYFSEDNDMDGTIKYTGIDNDRDPILVNIGGAVPTNTRSEQLP